MNAPIPDYWLERYLLNELPDERMREIGARLAADPALTQRLESLRASNREILSRHPLGVQAAAIKKRARAEAAAPVRFRPALGFAAAALVAGLVPLWLWVAPESIRTKGAEQALYLYRRTPQGAERLAGGETARAGDLLRMVYFADAPGYGVILSLDGRGQVTVHFPSSAGPAQVAAGARVALDRAYELDDAPDFERFWFLYSRVPLSSDAARAAADRLARDPTQALSAPLDLPADVRQTSLTLRKEARR